jgi:hypothetical protein
MRRAGAAIPEPPGPAHASDICAAQCRGVDRCGDERSATAKGDRAQNVSSSLVLDGREGFRSLARRLRATFTVSFYPS